ncbi:hypothetical protein [Nocardia puris]|uniref:hypothetical protein n=1 Tax=Nocardia puris TaxID=208602 RepID=UPI002E203FEA
MTDTSGMTAAQREAEWQKISRHIEQLIQRVGDPGGFPVPPGSMLAHDDEKTAPRQISHAFHSCVTAGIDHLHALKTLVRDAGIIHTMAPFSLARGALENLSIAFWLLHPAQRAERLEHLLRWHAQNINDSHTALEGRGLPNSDKTPKLAKLQSATKTILPRTDFRVIKNGHTSTEAVNYANQFAPTAGNVLFAWRLCSGYAHGRAWAILGASDYVEDPTDDPTVVGLWLSANDNAVLWVTHASSRLAADAINLYNERSTARRSTETNRRE